MQQVPHLSTVSALVLALALASVSPLANAQDKPAKSGGSSSSTGESHPEDDTTSGRPRAPRTEAAGAAITLETSEALFDIAVALNACGYDRDLSDSLPVRTAIRTEVDDATHDSPEVKQARQALCLYIHEHELKDKGRELAQYVSLALYVTPPPELAPAVDLTEMPPDAAQVVNVLPLVRNFANALVLHGLWQKHRPEYEAVTNGIHDAVTKMILDTNVYLRLPVSSYDGRRFLILMEPMLSPRESNGRIYATDYIVVDSPTAKNEIRMDQIRHIYLQYTIDPLIYSRAAAMDRLLPLLKPVQKAPLEFAYKSDMTLLLTECLIKAVEARTMDVGFPRPKKPTGHDRQDDIRYGAELAAYNRSAEEVRRRTVDLDMRQGWALTNYFYEQLTHMEHDSIGLKENIAEMVYGMDVLHEEKEESDIVFLPPAAGSNGDFVKRAPRPITGMMLAEKKMLEGDIDGAKAIAARALADPAQDHAEANYVMARVDLMENQPTAAVDTFAEVLRTSNNPHTLAWSYIYLGRLYDTQQVPNRAKAMSEYKAALSVQGITPDAKYAAQDGLKEPYALPKGTVHTEEDTDAPDAPIDPSGRAAKAAYKPDAPQ